MNDQDMDRLLASAALSEAELNGLELDEVEAELRDAIIASPREVTAPPGRSLALAGPVRRLRRVPLRTLGAAAAAVLIAAVALQPFSGGTRAWAEVLIDAAESSPLLLVDEPGWQVTRADVYGRGGEMTFTSDQGRELDVHWRLPESEAPFFESHEGWVADRAASADHREDLTVLGREATLLRYAGSAHDVTTLFELGDQTIEVRGTFATIDNYRRVLLSLERVDVDTWLSALPDSVIQAADRAPVVREMLADVPVPNGFDAVALETGTLSDGYQLGAEVTGAVVCAWIDQWLDGHATGDQVAIDEATDAMRTSRDWAVFQEMTEDGEWPQSVWEYADAMAGDGTVMGGRVLTIQESYGNALGCHD